MALKTSHHIIKGMNKDLSKSKFNGDFAYDAQNIRITAREGETLLTVTNEKGNSNVVSFNPSMSSILGYCVLDKYLTVFGKSDSYDVINRVDMTDFSIVPLYDGRTNGGNLNFSNKIEALGVYENISIQKVYWVDGINQPRVINIVKDNPNYTPTSFDFVQELSLQETVTVTRSDVSNGIFSPGTIQYAFTYYNKYGQESNIFYTTELMYTSHTNRGASPEDRVSNSFNIEIKYPDTKFDYVRIYSIHRTSLDAVPVVKRVADMEISVTDSNFIVTGGHKELYARPSTNFPITVNGQPLSNFNTEYWEGAISTAGQYYKFKKEDYPNIIINIGSGMVTWGDASEIYISEGPVGGPGNSRVQIVHGGGNGTYILVASKLEQLEPKVSFVDIGTSGVDIDPTQLLYIGGESIIAGTLAQKDQTLFLGDITLDRESIPQEIKDALLLKDSDTTGLSTSYREIILETDTNSGYYSHSNSLKHNTASFKTGEHYRLGVQFQHKSGKWSEPLFIKDFTIPTSLRPSFADKELKVPRIHYTINNQIVDSLISSGYKKARAVVVFPSLQDRKIILQGMLCPTVFNLEDRNKNTPYAQSSWFTRPFLPKNVTYADYSNNDGVEKGAIVEFRHWYGLFMGNNRGAEIQSSVGNYSKANYTINEVNSSVYSDVYMVDQSVLTMHSPDIEFDTDIAAVDSIQFDLNLVGLINFTSSVGDIDIQTSTPTIEPSATGFVNKSLGNFQKLLDDAANTQAARSLVSGLFYKDYIVDDSKNASEIEVYTKQTQEISYMVYPWHRSGSLNNDYNRPNGKGTRSSVLKKKKISNLKFSANNKWLTTIKPMSITQVQLFNSNEVSLIKIPSPANSGYTALNYYGNVDTLATPKADYDLYIQGDPKDRGKTTNFVAPDITKLSSLPDIGDYADRLKVSKEPVRMKYKSSPHLVFSLNYSSNGNPIALPSVGGLNRVTSTLNRKPFWLTGINDNPEQSDFTTIKYRGDIEGSWDYIRNNADYNYGDILIDTTSWDNRGGYLKVYTLQNPSAHSWEEGVTPMYMSTGDKRKFKYSEGHNSWYYEIRYMGSYLMYETRNPSSGTASEYEVEQSNISESVTYPFLFLAELVRPSVTNAFGGTTDDAIKENQWLPVGKPVPFAEGEACQIEYTYGDTWYQRYDCLKTYAFTPEDENQVVEIASFMCETRVNIDGRYDRNRGQVSNLNMSPKNFNLLNPIYSQKDNFFNYRILDKDYYKLNKFPTTITWSKEKSLAEEVDTWANITMANTLDLDGDKGKINALRTFNNEIFCFQDSGISNILFNSRVQIPASDRVPIEISNGYKVDGKRYLSNTIGCKNKWSIAESPNGLYFLDEDSNGLYLFNGQLDNISARNSMENWVKNNKHSWYGTFYDKNNGDVYFTTDRESLVYSEKLTSFTSFMSYGGTDFMFNVDDGFYAVKGGNIWKQFEGDYNSFYGVSKPYSITVISNQDMPYDKIFNNIEFRADSWSGDALLDSTFDKLEVWNEYQHGVLDLSAVKDKPSVLKKKFRVWRANIPRDNGTRNRIRNTWAYVKLEKANPSTERTELHDIMVHYFI